MAFTKKEIKALILYYERVRPGFVGIPGNPTLYDWVEDYRWKHQPPRNQKKKQNITAKEAPGV